MPTRFEEVVRILNDECMSDLADYVRELHYSHGVLLAELKYMKAQLKEAHMRVSGFVMPQLRADEAIRQAEELER